MRALIPRSGGFRLARFLTDAAFSGVKHNIPSPLGFGTSSLRSRSPPGAQEAAAGPGAEARRDRMTGPETCETRQPTPRWSAYRGRPDVAGELWV
jgi:hypothetical protein